MNCDEARELITGLIDNELSGTERSLIEGHLKDCSRCVRAYEREQSVKRELQRVAASMSAPVDLKRRILTRHGLLPSDSESASGWSNVVLSSRPFLRPVFVLAFLLIVLLPVIYLLQLQHTRPISLEAVAIQQKIMNGEVSLRMVENRNELRDWQIRAVNGEFKPMEYDLSSIQFESIGGVVQEINGRKIIVTVYKGPSMSVTCFTLSGTDEDAPTEATVFYDQGRKINFYSFSRNGYNAVLHREGDVICILMSAMPPEKLLALAMGKPDRA